MFSAFLFPCRLALPPEGLSEYLVAKTQAGMLVRLVKVLVDTLGVFVVWDRSIGSSVLMTVLSGEDIGDVGEETGEDGD